MGTRVGNLNTREWWALRDGMKIYANDGWYWRTFVLFYNFCEVDVVENEFRELKGVGES